MTTAIQRFSARVRLPEVEDGCWMWTSATVPNGYGVIRLGGKTRLAHRVSYELFVGPIPTGLLILHGCDVKDCVNPAHLRAGTQKENLQDRKDRGRDAHMFIAAHRAKTHCPQGHPYDEKNTRTRRGSRECRTCNYARLSRWRSRRRAAGLRVT